MRHQSAFIYIQASPVWVIWNLKQTLLLSFSSLVVNCESCRLCLSTWATAIQRSGRTWRPGSALSHRGAQGSPGNEGSLGRSRRLVRDDQHPWFEDPKSGELIGLKGTSVHVLFGSSEWSGQLSVYFRGHNDHQQRYRPATGVRVSVCMCVSGPTWVNMVMWHCNCNI